MFIFLYPLLVVINVEYPGPGFIRSLVTHCVRSHETAHEWFLKDDLLSAFSRSIATRNLMNARYIDTKGYPYRCFIEM